jgi:hypothetical protein
MYTFKNFSTNEEARYLLNSATRYALPNLITNALDQAKTVKILHDEPEVHRIWWELGEVRIAIHRIFPCKEKSCFFHPHPWPSAVECIQGGYTHRVAMYNGPREDVFSLQSHQLENFSNNLTQMEMNVVKGFSYYMPDIRQFHQVDVERESYSIFISGLPYFEGATKQFSRSMPVGNTQLTELEMQPLLNVAKRYLRI